MTIFTIKIQKLNFTSKNFFILLTCRIFSDQKIISFENKNAQKGHPKTINSQNNMHIDGCTMDARTTAVIIV